MPFRNRVTPFGEIVATPERGTMFGNRGILHDAKKQIVRVSQVRRWICCVLSFKGIRRTIMKPRSYTELFFLDEATALSAGHRPCFECRRQAARDFQSAWAKAFGVVAKADEMDRVLDEDRTLRGGGKKMHLADVRGLPDGTFVAKGGVPWLVHNGRLLRWTPGGYTDIEELGAGAIHVLTPRATVRVIRAGYAPGLHATLSRGGRRRSKTRGP
jgi:hypothetical protein